VPMKLGYHLIYLDGGELRSTACEDIEDVLDCLLEKRPSSYFVVYGYVHSDLMDLVGSSMRYAEKIVALIQKGGNESDRTGLEAGGEEGVEEVRDDA